MKTRYPRRTGLCVARMLVHALKPVTERLIVAGSLRRGRQDIGDVEVLFIPTFREERDPNDMFARRKVDLADRAIREMLRSGLLELRTHKNNTTSYGPKNKYLRHIATGMPVDLFTADEKNWHNYLVCRTGPAESNTRIATAARERGWRWKPYGAGFVRLDNGDTHRVTSEEDVFRFVGLPYLPPTERT